MIANVWPESLHIEETLACLKFATRMLKVNNEASVNVIQDPTLLIKRYEKEIRDLKQELAMHDTLKNRGRINYAAYGPDELDEVRNVAENFLKGERDDIGEINSLKHVREVFSYIKLQYRRTQQNVDAIRRQAEANPEAFKSLQKETAQQESAKSIEKTFEDAEEEKKDGT